MDKIFNIRGKVQEAGQFFGFNFVGEFLAHADGSVIGYIVTTHGCQIDNGCMIGMFVNNFDKVGIIFHKYTENNNRPALYMMPDINNPDLGCWIMEDIHKNSVFWKMSQNHFEISPSVYSAGAEKRIMDRFNWKFSGKLVPGKIKYNSGWYRDMFVSAIENNIV